MHTLYFEKLPFFCQFINWRCGLLLIVETHTFYIGPPNLQEYTICYEPGVIWLFLMDLTLRCHRQFPFDVLWL